MPNTALQVAASPRLQKALLAMVDTISCGAALYHIHNACWVVTRAFRPQESAHCSVSVDSPFSDSANFAPARLKIFHVQLALPSTLQPGHKQHTFDAELVVTLLGSPKCSIARPPTVLPRQPFRQILASSERPKVTLSLRVPANHYPVTPTVAGSGGCQQSGSGPFLEAGRWAFGATRARPPRCFLGPSLPSRFFPPGTGRLTHQNARPRTCKLRSNSP